jgi:hypothetical protein
MAENTEWDQMMKDYSSGGLDGNELFDSWVRNITPLNLDGFKQTGTGFQLGVHSSNANPYLHADYCDGLYGAGAHIQLDLGAAEFMANKYDVNLMRTDTSILNEDRSFEPLQAPMIPTQPMQIQTYQPQWQMGDGRI